MNIRRLVVRSLTVGLAAILLWVVLWFFALPDVWPGYDAHVVRVFFLGFIAPVAMTLIKPLLRRG